VMKQAFTRGAHVIDKSGENRGVWIILGSQFTLSKKKLQLVSIRVKFEK
jgi:hypothetical protein